MTYWLLHKRLEIAILIVFTMQLLLLSDSSISSFLNDQTICFPLYRVVDTCCRTLRCWRESCLIEFDFIPRFHPGSVACRFFRIYVSWCCWLTLLRQLWCVPVMDTGHLHEQRNPASINALLRMVSVRLARNAATVLSHRVAYVVSFPKTTRRKQASVHRVIPKNWHSGTVLGLCVMIINAMSTRIVREVANAVPIDVAWWSVSIAHK